MKYRLILQSNASKEFFIFSGLTDSVNNHLYHRFDDLELEIPEGEYTYILVPDQEDVEHILRTPLIDSSFIKDGVEKRFSEINPPTGLLRVGDIVPNAIFEEQPIFEEQEEENNNKIFYYEG